MRGVGVLCPHASGPLWEAPPPEKPAWPSIAGWEGESQHEAHVGLPPALLSNQAWSLPSLAPLSCPSVRKLR